jgi:hypothetical protein
MTLAEPALTADTSPLELTDAIAVFVLVQLTARPERTLPPASRVTAVNCTVLPTCKLGDAGDTDTDATGTAGTGMTVSGR